MLFLPRLVHATLPPFPELTAPTESIDVQTALLLLIAGALVYVAKLLADVRNRLNALEARAPARTAAAPAAGSAPGMPDAGSATVPPQILATIAAAIHATLRVPHRVVAVSPSNELRAWSLEGRRQVFQSHQIR